MADLFSHHNYREYLRAFYNEQKASRKNFSYRSFSEHAGIAAPSFLYYVMEGKRNLSKSTIVKISQAIGHSREEADYFENLVFFNQASTVAEKTFFYGRLIEQGKPRAVSIIGKEHFEYYSAWYHSVIREIVTFFNFNGDFDLLGSFLVPSIKGIEAERSVRLLERLGFIVSDERGAYCQTNNLLHVRVGAVDSFIVEKFQIEMLKVAMRAYDSFPVRERITTTTTFSISRETFELFKVRLREMQKQLMDMAGIYEKPEVAYQLILNLFPISRTNGNDQAKK